MPAVLTDLFVSEVELRRLLSDFGEYFFHSHESTQLYLESPMCSVSKNRCARDRVLVVRHATTILGPAV